MRFSIGSPHPVSSSPVNAPKGWKKFTSKEYGFSIYFPGTPIKDMYKDSGGSYNRYAIVDDNNMVKYSASYAHFPADDDADTDTFTEQRRKTILRNYIKLLGIGDDRAAYTNIGGRTAVTYATSMAEDNSVTVYRAVVLGRHGFYALDAFGVSEGQAKAFRDTFRTL
ncbi:MAG: hypothetical protein ACFNZQ_03350 [Scardovia wiggsiae]|uniref:hypothetical protein n=1 Tax=Scardovia wiggsiae TaxID=230143 RepID=UPI00362300C3